jgi:hypothetical protein
VGTTSPPKTVTLTNMDTAQLNFTAISITGTNAGDFAETNTCGSSIAAGANCTITVTFTPTATGKRTAAVTIGDDGGGSPQKVSLTGTGTSMAVTATTLSSLPNPSVYGQAVTITATVTSISGAPPDGETITFMKGTTVLGTGLLSGGSASFTISALPVGTNYITAVYGGDSNLIGSKSKGVNQVVSKATTTTILTSSLNPSNFGQSVTFTATVTPQYSGTVHGYVTFYDGTTALKTVYMRGGVAKYTTLTLPGGTTHIKAMYGGDANFAPSTSEALKQVVNKATTTTTLTSSLNPSNLGQAVTLTATVIPQFSGTVKAPVTFYDGTTVLKTVGPSGGVAKYTTSTLTSGSHSITATFNGGTNFLGSSASLTQKVN